MKKVYWILAIILPVVFVFSLYGLYDQGKKLYLKENKSLGSGFTTSNQTLAGTLTNFSRMPYAYSFTNTTTTDPALDRGGDTITQLITTGGIKGVYLYISAKGGTATSALSIYPQVSYDGTNYFYMMGSSTSTATGIGTTTIPIDPFIYTFAPGLVTTTAQTSLFDTRGAEFMRFVIFGQDVSTDPNDFVKAFIKAVLVEEQPK